MNIKSWISPKTTNAKKSRIHGLGFFAIEDIQAGEVVAFKAGHLIDGKTLKQLGESIQHSELQIADDFYIAPVTPEEVKQSMIYINHSCEPNVVILGHIANVALRDIKKGEELTADYGISFNNPEFRMECNCQLSTCRKVITGIDWQKAELQDKYGDNFPWFILQKIKASK